VQLLHESYALVVGVSFRGALCVCVLTFPNLPLHRDQGWGVSFVSQTGAFRVRLLERSHVA